MQPKVAVLKPLSSAISIGTGGPFGAEGPIIMTGGAIGSLFAQCFSLSAAERKTLAGRGRGCRHDGDVRHAGRRGAAGRRAAPVRMEAAQPHSRVSRHAPSRPRCGRSLLGSGPLFPVFRQRSSCRGGAASPSASALASSPGCNRALLTGAALQSRRSVRPICPFTGCGGPRSAVVAVGLGGLVEPSALGVGYDVIGDLLANHMTVRAVIAAFSSSKSMIWIVALASGTSGGVLAPLLIFGGCVGCARGAVSCPAITGTGPSSAWRR